MKEKQNAEKFLIGFQTCALIWLNVTEAGSGVVI